jgi:hypothetical protein
MNDEKTDKRVSSIISSVNQGTKEPDEQLLDTLRERSASEFVASSARGSKKLTKTINFSKWRIIMKSRIIKLAAAAVIIIAAVLSLTVWDTSAYALEQTIRAYESLRYVHIKDFKQGESEPQEFWMELDEQEQMKRFRAYLPAWTVGGGPLVGVLSEGKLHILGKNDNVFVTKRAEALALEILNIVKGFNPVSVVKQLRQLEAEGKARITTSEPPSKSEPIVITAKLHLQNDKGGQMVLFVDQSTKLVTRIILPINDSGDGYQHSLEFSDYNTAVDERVFRLEVTLDDTKTFMKNINAKLATLDINTSTVADVISVLGEPLFYRFRGKSFQKDNLPGAYTMSYPGGFIINIYKNQVVQWGCQQTPGDEIPGYIFLDSIQIGTPLDDVFEELGPPAKVVEGFGTDDNKIMYEDNTSYANMNINERKGFCFSRYDDKGKEIKIYLDDNILYKGIGKVERLCFYGAVSNGKRIRFSFMDNKVIAMYEYRTEPIKEIE